MPILTNHEVTELRKMLAFACRLMDLIEADDELSEPAKEIAAELEISLPIKEKPEA